MQQKHFQCHVAAYEATHIRPKAHYGLHLSQQIQKVQKFIDCFCCERKHKGYKRLAQKSFLAPFFAQTCLLELVTRELHSAMDASLLGTCLLGTSKSKAFPGLASPSLFAQGIQIEGVKYVQNQFVQLTETHAVASPWCMALQMTNCTFKSRSSKPLCAPMLVARHGLQPREA